MFATPPPYCDHRPAGRCCDGAETFVGSKFMDVELQLVNVALQKFQLHKLIIHGDFIIGNIIVWGLGGMEFIGVGNSWPIEIEGLGIN